MPKFSAIPPIVDTTGDWDEMAFPAGEGVGLIRDVPPAAQVVTSMMSSAHRLLSAS
jgi:enoyl-[acyl-carrier protein] reductase II